METETPDPAETIGPAAASRGRSHASARSSKTPAAARPG